MATYRKSNDNLGLGTKPPQIVWSIVRGDTSSFRVYVTDDSKQPLTISQWTVRVDFKRPSDPKDAGIITDNATLVLTLNPTQTVNDAPGEFVIFLNRNNSALLQTGDIFDIELSDATRVWTVGQGSMVVYEDVTN